MSQMAQGEEVPLGDPAQGKRGSGNARGVLVAALVLVFVLIAAGIAYHMLLGEAGDKAQVSHAADEAAADAKLWLSDFDCTVYVQEEVPLTLGQIADGKPLVVNFWATWCPYCLQEMDDYQAIYDEYSDRVAFAFIDATDGQRETVDKARDWILESGYTLPFYYDLGLEAVAAFGVQAFPTTVVVAADGEIMAVSPGVIDPDLMRNALDTLVQA